MSQAVLFTKGRRWMRHQPGRKAGRPPKVDKSVVGTMPPEELASAFDIGIGYARDLHEQVTQTVATEKQAAVGAVLEPETPGEILDSACEHWGVGESPIGLAYWCETCRQWVMDPPKEQT